MKTIGVLALQGAFKEHVRAIEALGHIALEIRKVEELDAIDGLILPGGESTAIGKLLVDFGIKSVLIEKIKSGLPVWGTCAGMILLAKELVNDDLVHLGTMDIVVRRNAYGRQLGSFQANYHIKGIDGDYPMVFIRAPFIERVGQGVEVISTVEGNIVAARQGTMLVTSFHPELTDDNRLHDYFIQTMI